MTTRSTTKVWRRALLAATMAAAAMGGTAGAAAAEPTGAGHASGLADASWTAQQVRGLLTHNSGSRQVDGNTVEVAKGVAIDVPVAPYAVQGCATYYLCLSEHADFGGYQIRFYYCGNVNLGNYRMPDGRTWNDKVSSIRNAQSAGVQSRFYNYDGSGDPNSSANWRFVIGLNAGNYLRNLATNTSADGGYANDKIDIVHVC